MVIKIPASEASEKVNRYTKTPSAHSLRCTVQPSLLRLSPLALAVSGRAQPTRFSVFCRS